MTQLQSAQYGSGGGVGVDLQIYTKGLACQQSCRAQLCH